MSEPRSRDDPADDLRIGGASDPSGIGRNAAFTFRFDGHEVGAHPGETIAGALLAAGHRQLRSTRIGGRPRGLFCAIGACFDCLVRADGDRPIRACLTAAAPDMEIGPGNLDAKVAPGTTPTRTSDPGTSARTSDREQPRRGGRPSGRRTSAVTDGPTFADVVVLGAGPAGVPAALAAADVGARIALIDANPRPGGQYHRQFPSDFQVARPGALHHGWPKASTEIAAVASHPRIDHKAGTHVWLVEDADDQVLVHTTGAHRGTVAGGMLVLASGATERVLPFPGWDLPGVLTVGAAQALVKGQGVRPGRRVLLAGTGPLLLAAASTLLAVGTQVAAVLDANGPRTWTAAAGAGLRTPPRLLEAAGYLADLARGRVPYLPNRAVIRVDGDGQVERATVARVDDGWRVVPGSEETYDVDTVCVSFGFTPDVGIAAALGCELSSAQAVRVDAGQRTSVGRVLAAGEVTGVAGASVAALEGRVAGAVAAHDLGFVVDRRRIRRQVRRRDRERRAAEALARAAPIRDGWTTWMDDDTIVCRCEEVDYGHVRHAIDQLGAGDVRSVKMTTRCGMGLCQATMCAPTVVDLVRAATGHLPEDAAGLAHRSITETIPLGDLG